MIESNKCWLIREFKIGLMHYGYLEVQNSSNQTFYYDNDPYRLIESDISKGFMALSKKRLYSKIKHYLTRNNLLPRTKEDIDFKGGY